MFSENRVDIDHASSLVPGDYLVLGKRKWIYLGRTADLEEFSSRVQNEYVFEHDGDPNGLDRHRVMSQSELESLMTSGRMFRLVPATLNLLNLKVNPRDLKAVTHRDL